MMRVVVNWALCDGNGNCAREAPEVFELDDDDNLRLLKEEVEPAEEARVVAAVRVCPKSALSIAK